MGHPSQAGFDSTDNNWDVSVSLTGTLTVNRHRSVGTLSSKISGGVGIVVAPLFICSVVIDHRVHIAGRDAKEEIGFS